MCYDFHRYIIKTCANRKLFMTWQNQHNTGNIAWVPSHSIQPLRKKGSHCDCNIALGMKFCAVLRGVCINIELCSLYIANAEYLPHFESQYLVHLQILIKIVQETLSFHTYMV